MTLHLTHSFYPFISLTAGIFQVVLIFYLLRLKQKSRATWYMIGFFSCILLALVSIFFTNALVFWGSALWGFQDAWIVLASVFMLLFIYSFPQNDRPKELIFFTAIFGSIAFASLAYSIYFVFIFIFDWSPSLRVNEVFLYILPSIILAGVPILVRRVFSHTNLPSPLKVGWWRYSKSVISTLISPQNAHTLAFRNFLLALLVSLIPGVGSIIAQYPPFSAIVPAYLVALGVIMATAALSLVYFNHAPEPFSFNVKLVGISLVTFLTIFAAIGVEDLASTKNEDLQLLELEIELAEKSVIANNLKEIPDIIRYIRYWPDLNTEGQAIEIFVRPDGSQVSPTLDKDVGATGSRLAPRKSAIHNISELDHTFNHMLMAEVPLFKTIGHRFIHQNKIYEIGVDLSTYHTEGHDASVKLIQQVIVSSLLILIFFPYFFRINLLVPLKRLLRGVKQTNSGQLDINIPVQFEDEIGFLTQSFNDMVQSLKKSNLQKDELNAALKKINEELEFRVKERTAQLNEAKNDLEIRVEKRTADLAKAKEEAEVANLAKNNFLASVSHELRTPLHHILGFSQILQGKDKLDLAGKQAGYTNNIINAGNHLLSLIDDILDLSQVDLGKMELRLSRLSLKELLEKSLTPIREKDLKTGLSVTLDFPKEIENITVVVDEPKLKQIMFNLLSNAVKFTADDGEIRVAVEKQGENIIIHVSDTGIGILPEYQDSIFTNFFQVQDGVRGKTPGVGLGLPISRRMVELHGGKMWVNSSGTNQGSQFSFSIPVQRDLV